MEKDIFFFCLFSYWIMQITTSDASGSSAVRVQMGEDITLNCSMRNRYEVAWYHLRSEELVLLISGEKDNAGTELLNNYNQNSSRLKIITDNWITTVSLVISGVTESDSGLYFCGVKSDAPEMHFDKPIRLEIEALPHPDGEHLHWPEILNGVLVITAIFAFLVITAVQIVLRVFGRW